MTKVFVYGSLLKGMGNNPLLKDSKLLGEAKITGFTMLDLGWFPGIIHDEKAVIPIKGEVYDVDEITLHYLDRLEGYNPFNPKSGLYNKATVDTDWGKAIVYTYNRASKVPVDRMVHTGDWRLHYENKLNNMK